MTTLWLWRHGRHGTGVMHETRETTSWNEARTVRTVHRCFLYVCECGAQRVAHS